MVFNPAIPLGGIGGWRFLERTYDRQLESFAQSPQIQNDREYMLEKLSKPVAVEDFLDDRRLLRVTMTAFGLNGEEWKRGFIDKVLTEVGDPESTFLQRLNNPAYTRFAEAFTPQDGQIAINAEARMQIADNYEAEAFEIAVGEVDNSMRLALNFQAEIPEITSGDASEDAILFRMLGSVPVRTVLESALNLPSDVRQLPIERQAEIFKERLQANFGINDVSELADPENITTVVERFHAVSALSSGPSASSPGSTALLLLGGGFGFGSAASQNLFLGTL